MSDPILTAEEVAAERVQWSQGFIVELCDSHEALRAERDEALRTADWWMRVRTNGISHRVATLEAALRDAIESVEEWAAYASDYFRGEHALARDLARLRAALGDQEAVTVEHLS